jgi:dihydropteroate synthase
MLNINGKLLDLSLPKVMGILNVTPDSFFDGGRHTTDKDALTQVEKMLNEGADFIDIGAYSTRPDAKDIPEEEEWKRLSGILKNIKKHFPETIISVDTFRSGIAKKSIEEGASMINDISAGQLDDQMFSIIIHYKIPYIMMHMRGTPQTMKQLNVYQNISLDIIDYFIPKIKFLHNNGVSDLIIDPGFGFAKNIEQNFELLAKTDAFKILDLPLLAGLSRKSMIYKTLDISAEDALNGTTALNMIALQKGASILRVHDVKEAKECVRLFEKLKKYNF